MPVRTSPGRRGPHQTLASRPCAWYGPRSSGPASWGRRRDEKETQEIGSQGGGRRRSRATLSASQGVRRRTASPRCTATPKFRIDTHLPLKPHPAARPGAGRLARAPATRLARARRRGLEPEHSARAQRTSSLDDVGPRASASGTSGSRSRRPSAKNRCSGRRSHLPLRLQLLGHCPFTSVATTATSSWARRRS